MADADGLGVLTMRNLGSALGVEAMSLYNHVRGKDDILDGIVDVVLSEIDLSPTSADWKVAMRQTAISAHDALLRHRWACQLILSPSSTSIIASRLRYIEAVLARFRAAGFSPEGASRGYHAVDSHVLGFTLWELGHSLPADAPADFLDTLLGAFDFSNFPFLAEHVGVHLAVSDEPAVGEFEFGLDLILDGLERIKETV
jgi:AcrR family transcriptional regulator